ncbi:MULTISPECIES: DUF2786 domain-containing protein [Nocardia]|uniref:DUF2786 domain-containing protein n=1 Tax=Nocardia TaxID=1817 RepID=UPI000D69C9AC|nr:MULTISPECIES: DUF2786 domain-containing protein [Nocardia]
MESEQDSQSTEKMLRRIRGLFAKAEGTDNEKEAETFRAKAYELLTKHNLDEMKVRASGQHNAASARDDQIVVVRFDLPLRYREQRMTLLAAVMRPFYNKDIDCGSGVVRCVGVRAQIEKARFLYSLLLPQMLSATSKYVPDDPFDHSAVVRERSSFMNGFSTTVYQRLLKAATDAINDAGGGAAVAVRDLVSRVDAAFDARFPNRSKGVAHRHGGEGFAAGARSGNAADVGHTRLNGNRQALGS